MPLSVSGSADEGASIPRTRTTLPRHAYPSSWVDWKGMLMWWIAAVVLALALLGVAAWVLGPSLKTFFGPGFEPTSKDEASVERAQQSGPASGTGAGGGGV